MTLEWENGMNIEFLLGIFMGFYSSEIFIIKKYQSEVKTLIF